MSNADAFGLTLKELRRLGRIEKVDAALVEAIRSMAESLDVKPYNSQMFHEYLAALEGLTCDDDSDGTVEQLLADLSTEVRNPSSS